MRKSKTSSHSNPQEAGINFENYVASLYEGLGFSVKTNAHLSGQQIDILAEKNVSGFGFLRIIVECKYRSQRTVSNQDVYDFITMVNAIRETHKITKGIIVTNTKFTADAFSAAQPSGIIELLTTEALENNLFELHDIYRDFIKQYESSDIFLSYVPLRATFQYFDSAEKKPLGKKSSIPNIEHSLIDWIDSSKEGFLSILADFGSGKTTLLERLKYHYAKKYVNTETKVKPIIFSLKEFHRMGTLDALIQDCIRREYKREMPLTLFWRTAIRGELLLLLDGFDEMVAQVDTETRRENFLVLSPLFTLKSKAIMTCRPSYFVTEQEYEAAIRVINALNRPGAASPEGSERKVSQARTVHLDTLLGRLFSKFINHEPLRSISGRNTTTVHLETFNESQIDSFLMKFDAQYQQVCSCDWKRVKEFLMSIYDLSDLMKRPILLAMINETILSSKISISSIKIVLGPSSLYELYTTMKLEVDWHKGKTRQLLTKGQRRDFAESIALGMFDRKKLEISFEEIKSVVNEQDALLEALRRKLDTVSVDQIAADIQLCTFLSRHQDGLFRFSHKSFMEYFVAFYLKRAIESDRVDIRFEEILPKEILYFLGSYALAELEMRQVLLKWHNSKVPSRSRDVFKRNLAVALLYSGHEFTNFTLQNTEVFDMDASKINMFKAKLSNVTFTRVAWEDSKIENSKLQNINYNNCEVRKLTLRESVISINIAETSINNLNALHSRFNISGRKASINRSDFRRCNIQVMGDIGLNECSFTGGKIELPRIEGDCMLSFIGCEFVNVNITDNSDHARQRVKFNKGCQFSNCLIFRLQVSGVEYNDLKLKDSKGVIVIYDSPGVLRFDGGSFLKVGDLFLILEKAWMEKERRTKLLLEIENGLGHNFFEKFKHIHQDNLR